MKKSTFTLLLAALFVIQGIAQQVEQRQRSLITKRTATWCPHCGNWGWTLYNGLIEDNKDKAVLIAAHFDDNLTIPASAEITQNFGGFYQPVFYWNEVNQNASSGNIANTRTSIKNLVDAAYEASPIANAGFAPIYQDGAIQVKSKVKFFKAAEGEFYLGIYLLEDKVQANQAGQTGIASHRFVMRECFTQSTWGTLIKNGSINAGTEFNLDFALPIGDPDGYNYEVAGIIWKKEGSKYKVVNVWSTSQIGELTGVEEPQSLVTFEIKPSITSSEANIQLQLSDNQADASIDLFDINGRRLKNIHRGSLSAGQHSFVLNREQAEGNGVYIVRLNLGATVVARKVIFQE
jgi:hypothetical protein